MTAAHKKRTVAARPLIVLDMKGMNPTPILTGFLREVGYDWLAAQIEAQTKPARIPEPGLWGVVEAGLKTYDVGVRYQWVRHENYWMSRSFSAPAEWANLIDPTLTREGVN